MSRLGGDKPSDDAAAGAAAGGRHPAADPDAARRRGVCPNALARQVTEKAEGNALFAEEILSFLTERGVLRVAGGKVEFDAGAVAAALPASVQSLLTARVDRLAPRGSRAAASGGRDRPALRSATVGRCGGRRGRHRSAGSPRCRRSISSIPRASRATMPSSTRWCATRSIRACSRGRAPRCI